VGKFSQVKSRLPEKNGLFPGTCPGREIRDIPDIINI